MSIIRTVSGLAVALLAAVSVTACANQASSSQQADGAGVVTDAAADAGQVAASTAKAGPITVYKTPT